MKKSFLILLFPLILGGCDGETKPAPVPDPEPTHVCADSNSDHLCDICGNKLSDCKDNNLDHRCDVCGAKISNCIDNNKDHFCDICGLKTSECVDQNNNFVCDICERDMSKDLVGITIKKQPNKTRYYVDELFDPAGMVINAQYRDGTYEPVADYTYSENPLKLSDTYVDVVYKQFTVKITISVIEKPIVEDEYTATISLHGSTFASNFPEGTNFDNAAKFEELLEHIDEQLDYYDLINEITCVKCSTRKVDGDTFFQIGTGSPAKGKFNPGTFNWSCKEKIYKVEITAFNYSNPYEDYSTHQIVHNVDNLGHLILDDLDTSFEIPADAAPVTKTIVKEYPQGVQGFNLRSTGGRMLVSEMKITWRG